CCSGRPCRLSARGPDRDIPTELTAPRPGGKVAEELVGSCEVTVPTSIDKIRIVQRNGADGTLVEKGLERLLAALAGGGDRDVINVISALVPEYVPWHDGGEVAAQPAVHLERRVKEPYALPSGVIPRPTPITRALQPPTPV